MQILRRHRQAPKLARSGASHSGRTVPRGRESLDAYLDDLAARQLMSPDQERALAERIVALRARYWGALLSHPPLAAAVVDVLDRELPTEDGAVERDTLRHAATALRLRRSRAGELAYGEAMAALGRTLAWVDLDTAVADRMLVDIEAIAAAQPTQTLEVHPPPHRGAGFSAYLARVRKTVAALRDARNEFAEANLRLVVKVARRYMGGHLTLSDLIQEGNLGLMIAIDRFDYRRGFRFSTYGCWWIRHTVQRALSNKDRTVRVPCHMGAAYANVAKARWAFAAHFGRNPTDEELAERAGISLEKLDGMTQMLLRPGESLDLRVPGSDGSEGRSRLDSLEDDTLADLNEHLDLGIQSGRMREALGQLSALEADILRKRFGLEDGPELTLRDLGQQHALSRERIRQIQNEALGKLRRLLEPMPGELAMIDGTTELGRGSDLVAS